MASRKIEDLVPELQEKFKLFKKMMDDAGIPFMVTCTYRSPQEQLELYAQGRTKPGPKVTWVKHSKHNDRKAFDIAITRDGKPVWDLKVDVSGDQRPDYEQAAYIGQDCGLIAGAFWHTPDYPHFEIE
jgi:peptidoglycan L-alanyl-D-glutamate endopeptidase CwlK